MSEIGHKLPVAPSPQTTNPAKAGLTLLLLHSVVFTLSQSESGDAETKKRKGGGLRRSR
jgi:hypothetical protein